MKKRKKHDLEREEERHPRPYRKRVKGKDIFRMIEGKNFTHFPPGVQGGRDAGDYPDWASMDDGEDEITSLDHGQ